MRAGADPRQLGLIVSGLILFGAMVWIGTIDPMRSVTLFLGVAVAASVAYLAAVGLIAAGAPASPRLVAAGLLLAVLWRIPLLLAPPLLSTDIYRYIWDGRVQRFGHNPYVSAPADPALQWLHTPLTARTEHADLPTIYPPVAELVFRAVASLQESVLAFKLVQLFFDGLIAGLLLKWLQITGRSPVWVLAYAWHPLAALEGAGSGHLDFLGVALLVAGVLALEQGRRVVAGIVLGLAVGVKFVPVVLAPLVVRRLGWRGLLAGGTLLLCLYGWFAGETGGLALGSLGEYARRWRFNGPLFLGIEGLAGMRMALAMPLVGGMAVAWYADRRPGPPGPAAWAWPIAVALLLAPAVYPWYLVWLLPFLTVRATAPLAMWSVTVLLTYAVWFSELHGAGWVLPKWVLPVEYGLVAAVGAWRLWRRTSTASVSASAAGGG